MPTYQTHDQDSRKFIVDIQSQNKKIDIYQAEYWVKDPFKGPFGFKKGELIESLKNYTKVWVGDNVSPSIKQSDRLPIGAHYVPKGKFKGNTILVQMSENDYIFIGDKILTFRLGDDTIIKYVSPVSENEYSMPYAVGKNNVYFFDKSTIEYLPKELFDLKLDAYFQRAQHRDLVKQLLSSNTANRSLRKTSSPKRSLKRSNSRSPRSRNRSRRSRSRSRRSRSRSRRSRDRSRVRSRVRSRSRSRRSRSKVRIPVRKGQLSKYGYGIHNLQKSRHRSLERVAKEYGALSVFKKLNVLITFNKNANPSLAKKFKKDRDWVKKHLMTNN
jgi:hypothetical protein